MKNTNIIFLALSSVVALVYALQPLSVYALESSSFRLYDEHPNYADRHPGTSTSFQMNEAGETWVGLPVASTSFQLVTAPPTTAAAAAATTGGGGGAQSPSGGGSSGGHRGHRTNEGGGSQPSAPKPSAPDFSGFISDKPDTAFEITSDPPVADVSQRAPRTQERKVDPLQFFAAKEDKCVCPEAPQCPAPTLQAPIEQVNLAADTMLVGMGFVAGFLSQLTRFGRIQFYKEHVLPWLFFPFLGSKGKKEQRKKTKSTRPQKR